MIAVAGISSGPVALHLPGPPTSVAPLPLVVAGAGDPVGTQGPARAVPMRTLVAAIARR